MLQKIKNSDIYIIAEMSANHAGDIQNALEIVRQAAKAGADCVKIQTYTADTLTLDCDNEYFKIKGGLWDGYTFYDLYKEAYMPWEWHQAIKDECEKCGVDFLSTPFDKTAVDYLEALDIKFYKVASFELVDIPLIEYIASKGKPMVMSCGMGSVEEIEEAVAACKRMGNDQIVLLKCCSDYPAKFEDMKLANIKDMQQRFPDTMIGLSDHSMGSLAAIIATSMGAKVIEKHVCLSRAIKNPDSEFSMEMQEFEVMVKELHDTVTIMGDVDYSLTPREKASQSNRRSVFVSKDIKAGEVFSEENIRTVRPAQGLAPKYYHEVLGEKALVDIAFGQPLKKEHYCK